MWDGNTSKDSNGGGGFMDESYNQTQGADDKKPTTTKSNSVIPMMIKQLYDATPDTLTFAGKPVKVVTLVAVVKKVERVSTKISYDLEDETGSIQAIRWLESEVAVPEDDIETNKYVQVFGSLRDQATVGRHLFLIKIFPLKSPHEIFTHTLEVVLSSLSSDEIAATRPDAGPTDTIIHPNGGISMNDDVDHGAKLGLDKDYATVLNIIVASEQDSGIDRTTIKQLVPERLVGSTDAILTFLASEGHIYTTCTDDFFKAT